MSSIGKKQILIWIACLLGFQISTFGILTSTLMLETVGPDRGPVTGHQSSALIRLKR